jgi:hypothetical protein
MILADIDAAVWSYVIGYFMRFTCFDRALSLDTCWMQIDLHPTTSGWSIKKESIAARSGDAKSLDAVRNRFKEGFVSKDKYANSLRECQMQQDEAKSPAREWTVEYLIRFIKQGFHMRNYCLETVMGERQECL